MNRSSVFVVLLLAAVVVVALSAPTQAQVLRRHVAEYRFGAEQSTSVTAAAFPGPPDGAPIYTKTVIFPPDTGTVFITLSTTGDAHEGVAHWFSARINGQPCNLGNEGAGIAPSGWIPLQKHFDYEPPVTYTSDGVSGQSGGDGGGGTGDMHDNGIYYTWCCLDNFVPGTSNRVEIRMATSFATNPVYVERSHYYVDSVDAKLCNQAEPVGGVIIPAEAAAELEANRSGG